jgi:hypothetical protein
MADRRCPHFSLSIEETAMPGLLYPVRTPVYRCSIIDGLMEDLSTVAEGAVRIPLTPRTDGDPGCSIGPDGFALHPQACDVARFEKSCRSGALAILKEAGMETRGSHAALHPEAVREMVAAARERASAIGGLTVQLHARRERLRADRERLQAVRGRLRADCERLQGAAARMLDESMQLLSATAWIRPAYRLSVGAVPR